MKKSRWNKYDTLKEIWEDNPLYLIAIILNWLLSFAIIFLVIKKYTCF